ncbi:hypothetical protein BU26DRAFT_135713 [Trematosphaeria pertusa]|uniref:Uncharacterized protein n=1 Tax=Trematosphaeria pertusa TaxID=390896 RepID=A0A6A6IW26_9PLEO|nr:uncharacterized protein BU26DRAFT_135713 [Trematosphaeria pertusa]KAF2254277.1 hypothetical protein BU26DRAFT_135713 [Trematosphaeria pertusa]
MRAPSGSVEGPFPMSLRNPFLPANPPALPLRYPIYISVQYQSAESTTSQRMQPSVHCSRDIASRADRAEPFCWAGCRHLMVGDRNLSRLRLRTQLRLPRQHPHRLCSRLGQTNSATTTPLLYIHGASIIVQLTRAVDHQRAAIEGYINSAPVNQTTAIQGQVTTTEAPGPSVQWKGLTY